MVDDSCAASCWHSFGRHFINEVVEPHGAGRSELCCYSNLCSLMLAHEHTRCSYVSGRACEAQAQRLRPNWEVSPPPVLAGLERNEKYRWVGTDIQITTTAMILRSLLLRQGKTDCQRHTCHILTHSNRPLRPAQSADSFPRLTMAPLPRHPDSLQRADGHRRRLKSPSKHILRTRCDHQLQ